ncbi:hypothetical protein A2U01_0068509, partial [Trifolium medium]|nr:hypothetical protein [Trifolium medium]
MKFQGNLNGQTNILKRRKIIHKRRKTAQKTVEGESDSIEGSDEVSNEAIDSNQMMASNMCGIGLEVVLPCSNEEVEKVPGSSSFCTSGREFRQRQSGVRDMWD